MKLASFSYEGREQWGVINDRDNTIISAEQLEEEYFIALPQTLLGLIRDEESMLALRTAIEKYAENPVITPFSLGEIELLPPIRSEKNIYCVGKNYKDHVREFEGNENAALPQVPIIFSKTPTSVIGSGGEIDLHKDITNEVDYEGELAIIIGKGGTHISEEDAWDHIFGYTIINDVTARDLQTKHVQWLLGKSLDTFCPMGPCILVATETVTPFHLETRVNGELRQSGNTDELIFSIPKLIATISQGITLEPGDILSTGTPEGVGMGFKPPRFLQSGDTISITIESIGTLTNTVK